MTQTLSTKSKQYIDLMGRGMRLIIPRVNNGNPKLIRDPWLELHGHLKNIPPFEITKKNWLDGKWFTWRRFLLLCVGTVNYV